MAALDQGSNGAPLSAGQIFRHRPPPPLRVEVPELGPDAYTYVRVLTAGERARLEAGIAEAREKGRSVPAVAVVACCCDQEGKLLFEEGAEADLDSADSRVVERIAAAAAEHNGLRPADKKETEKNSASAPSSASSEG